MLKKPFHISTRQQPEASSPVRLPVAPRELSADQLGDFLNEADLGLNTNVTDLIDKLSRSVVLDARHPFVTRTQGNFLLKMTFPEIVDAGSNAIAWFDEGRFELDGKLLVIFPAGKIYAVDIAVASLESGTWFFADQINNDTVQHFQVEAQAGGQHIVFAIDARAEGSHSLELTNKKRDKERSPGKAWTFFKCIITELD